MCSSGLLNFCVLIFSISLPKSLDGQLLHAKKLQIHVYYFGALDFDENYVANFTRTSPDSDIYLLDVVKTSPQIFIDIAVANIEQKRRVYHLSNMNGCDFLNSPLINRIMSSFYKEIVLNITEFKCPLKPQKIFLRNAFTAKIIPQMHPPGNYLLEVKVKSSPDQRSLLSLAWKYRVLKLKIGGN